MARDWGKHGAIAGYINVAVAVLGIGAMLWMPGHATLSPFVISWTWGVAALYFLGVILAGLLHLKAARIGVDASHDPPKTSSNRPLHSGHTTDLRGELLELYFHKDNDMVSFNERICVLMKVRITNHGTDEVAITRCGLAVLIGNFQVEGELRKNIPDSWRIKRKKESAALSPEYIETEIGPFLGESAEAEVYRKGVPRVGWLPFDIYLQENVDFPNAHFVLRLKDSLGGEHRIERLPSVYRIVGKLVTVPAMGLT